jgi:hypothetical protein
MTPFQRKGLIFFLIIPLILIIHSISFAQLSRFTGIKLNDGTVIYGKLLNVNVYVVKMETADGKIISIKFDDVKTFIDKAEEEPKLQPPAPPNKAEEETKRKPPMPLVYEDFSEEKTSNIVLNSTSSDEIIEMFGQPFDRKVSTQHNGRRTESIIYCYERNTGNDKVYVKKLTILTENNIVINYNYIEKVLIKSNRSILDSSK